MAGSEIFLMMTEWPGQGGPELGIADVQPGNEPIDGVDHQGGVHDGPVHDGLGGERLQPGFDEPVTTGLGVLELNELDRRGSDVQTYQILGLSEQHASPHRKKKDGYGL